MPSKGKVSIKKNAKKDNKTTVLKNKKKILLEESSIKSTDDDSIDRDEYDSEDFSEEDIDKQSEISNLDEETISPIEPEEEIEEADDETTEESEEEPNEQSDEDQGNDDCMYKKAKVKNFDADDEEELELVYDDDNVVFDEIVKLEDRITKPFMTIFERVRIIGDRAKQLSLGAKPMIKGLETMNPKEVAKLELEKGVMPLIIERVLPNGKKERWYTHELKIVN